MAVVSGQVNTNVDNSNYFWVKWQRSADPDIANNKTPIYWEAGCTLGHNYYSNAIRMSPVSINDTEVYAGGTYSNFNAGNHTIASGYLDITHDADGRKTFTIAGFTGWLYPSRNYSAEAQEFELPTIPRASSITATDANIGSVSTININRASSGFTHTITYSFGNLSGIIATKTSQTSIGWTVPTTFFEQIPNAQSGTVTLTCYTYNGNTHIGTKTTTMTVSVPTSGTYDSTPEITSASVRDTLVNTMMLTNDYHRLVLYKSIVTLSATGQCKNYAGFRSFKENIIYDLSCTTSTSNGTTTVNGSKTYGGSASSIFDKTQFKLYLIDSRGIISDAKILNEANEDFVIVPYVPLTINANIERVAPTSNSIKLNFSGNFYNGYFDENNVNFNDLTIKWRYKEVDGNWITTGADDTTNGWHNLTLGTDYQYTQNANTYSSINDIIIADLFDYQKAYVVEISYADRLSAESWSNANNPILKGEPIHDEGVDSSGDNYFNVNGDIYSNNEKISKQEITTGVEFATNEYIDGNRIYRRRYNCGALPNNSLKNVNTDLTAANNTVIRIEGIGIHSNGTVIQLPYVTTNGATSLAWVAGSNAIQLYTSDDRSAYNAYVDLYYTKNS